MKAKFILTAMTITALLNACATATPIRLLCNEQHVEIYVDDEYIGRGMVDYVVPKGQEYIQVSCREEGQEIYSRRLYIKSRKGDLIELQIPKDYRYSSEHP